MFHTLSWCFEAEYDADTIYFAHCYPYTYSDCQLMLRRLCSPNLTKDRLRRTELCRTKAGNMCDMLIVTNFMSTQDAIADRKCVIISGRVHPGESNSSHIMEGFVEFILGNEPAAKALRDHFVFKIVPMLNPDGVIVGNYRCSLAGLDLNRQWQNPSYKQSPEIHAMKDMIRKTLECRDIHLFVDFHGHSRQKNLFLYGCQHQSVQLNKHSKGPSNATALTHREKVLPILFSKTADWFSFSDCNFAVQKSKETTGRVSDSCKLANTRCVCLGGSQ